MSGLATRLLATLDRDRGQIRRQPERVLSLVDELLSPHFDIEYTARLVLGAHWHHATPEQRQRFAFALYRTLLQTYAGAVAEWTPDRLRILPQRDDPDALQMLVRTEIARPGVPSTVVDYRLHRTADGWKVFDVVVDGVSYVRAYHDDVDLEVEHQGLDAAIVRLESRKPAAVPSRSRG
jgi:phospholipid transport system substrate-binding protein